MLILPFVALDVIAGLILLLGFKHFAWLFGILVLLKGAMSVFSAVASGFYFDLMGYIDLLAGAALLLLSKNIIFGFFAILGVIILAKGALSFMVAR